MRRFLARLIYQKWFYGFLAVVLWSDSWTDLATVLVKATALEILSLVLSVAAALLVTLVFVDLHLRWPPERHQ